MVLIFPIPRTTLTHWENANVWLGHVLRRESLLRGIIEGRMKGKATRGRKRMHLLNHLMKNRRVNEKLKTEQAGELKLYKPADNSRWLEREISYCSCRILKRISTQPHHCTVFFVISEAANKPVFLYGHVDLSNCLSTIVCVVYCFHFIFFVL